MFRRWLENKKGFLHLDVEKPGVVDGYGLAEAWNNLFSSAASTVAFLDASRQFNRSLAIDWGFPPEYLSIVRQLNEAGVMLWWFAADWEVARRRFKEHGTVPIQVFDIQLRKIAAALTDIKSLFDSHVVYALSSTGIYTPPDEIWESMLDTFAESARQR